MISTDALVIMIFIVSFSGVVLLARYLNKRFPLKGQDEQDLVNLTEFLASSKLRRPVKFRGVEISKMPRNVLEDVLAWAVTNGCG